MKVYRASIRHAFNATIRLTVFALVCLHLSGCIVSVTSSSHDGHVPANTTDNDLSPESRWSAQGDGEWIQYQLLQSQTVGGLDIAFYRGSERISYFEIWLGENPDALTRVFQGQSSGNGGGFERFVFNARQARYVRIVGFGNSENSWNSLTEVVILGEVDDGGQQDDDGPDPVFRQTFEGEALGSHWLGMSQATVQAGCGVNKSRCLAVNYEPYDRGSRRLVKQVSLPPAKEYTLHYDVRFAGDFEFVKGGKMHGLGPVNKTTGCAPIESDGWSARVMWRRNGQAELYTYHQDRANNCGDNNLGDYYFTRGSYQAVSLYVRVNSSQDRSDGEIALYVNGREVARRQNVRSRSVINRDTQINNFLFSTFHGGSDETWAPSKTVTAYYDNFAVVPGLSVRSNPGSGG